MKQIIDIENWERKENFNFFRHFQNPQLSITSEVECGGARQRAKAAGQSFFLHYLYAVLHAANEIPEFRYRIDPDGRVVLYDTIDMLSPIKIKRERQVLHHPFPLPQRFRHFLSGSKANYRRHPRRRRSVCGRKRRSSRRRLRTDSVKCDSRPVFYFHHRHTREEKRQ